MLLKNETTSYVLLIFLDTTKLWFLMFVYGLAVKNELWEGTEKNRCSTKLWKTKFCIKTTKTVFFAPDLWASVIGN